MNPVRWKKRPLLQKTLTRKWLSRPSSPFVTSCYTTWQDRSLSLCSVSLSTRLHDILRLCWCWSVLSMMDGWQVVAADLQLIKGVAERLKQCHDPTWNHEVWMLLPQSKRNYTGWCVVSMYFSLFACFITIILSFLELWGHWSSFQGTRYKCFYASTLMAVGWSIRPKKALSKF